LQQDCSCDRGNAARPPHLGDARDLSCRISFGLLEFTAAASPARAFPPVWTPRLRALACIFTGRVAYILACIRWFAVSRGSFSNHYLFCNAVTGKSGSNATEDGVSARRLLNTLARKCGFAARYLRGR
jgi:hypothetical protein